MAAETSSDNPLVVFFPVSHLWIGDRWLSPSFSSWWGGAGQRTLKPVLTMSSNTGASMMASLPKETQGSKTLPKPKRPQGHSLRGTSRTVNTLPCSQPSQDPCWSEAEELSTTLVCPGFMRSERRWVMMACTLCSHCDDILSWGFCVQYWYMRKWVVMLDVMVLLVQWSCFQRDPPVNWAPVMWWGLPSLWSEEENINWCGSVHLSDGRSYLKSGYQNWGAVWSRWLLKLEVSFNWFA